MIISRKRLKFTIRRFTRVLRAFARSKKGVLGLSIILFFVAVAIFAPFLTPYDANGEDPNAPNVPLAGDNCAPTWLRYLPPFLGGNPRLSENMLVVKDSGAPKLLDEGGEWEFTVEDENVKSMLSAYHTTTENFPETKEGCIAITFKRQQDTAPQGKVRVFIEKHFRFPYGGPPERLSGLIALKVNGTTVKVDGENYLAIPIQVNVYMENQKGEKYILWPPPGKVRVTTPPYWQLAATYGAPAPTGFTLNKTIIDIQTGEISGEVYISQPAAGAVNGWIISKTSPASNISQIDSKGGVFIKRIGNTGLPTERYRMDEIFSTCPGNYTYGVEIIFLDEESYPSLVKLTGTAYILMPNLPPEYKYTGFPIPVQLNTTMFVPKPLRSGLFNGTMTGSASIRNQTIDFNVELNVHGYSIPLQFSVENVYQDEGLPLGKGMVKFTSQVELNTTQPKLEFETLEVTVYVDNVQLKLFGTAFGLLGTDQLGRDLFAQLIYGSRISLYVGLLTALLSVLIGLIIGLVSGFVGGAVDELLMRFTDMIMVLPGLPLLIVLVAVLGAKLENLIILLGFLGWMSFARMVRSQVLSLKERPFVEAAKAVGAGRAHIIFTHILPNVMGLVYVALAQSVPGAIVAEASLSWLGFFDPTRMSWGRMLYNVQFEAEAIGNWWWVLPPGLAIALLAIAFILLGYAIDDILNPKLRVRR